MHPYKGSKEDDHKRIFKSCRNLVQTEIRTMRGDLDSLRGFLRNCQDTINSETSKLEGKCLNKIQSLENERLDLERELQKCKDENMAHVSSSQKLEIKMRQLEKDVSGYVEVNTQLSTKVKSLESQLSTKSEHCTEMRRKLEKTKLDCLSLQNKLASNEAYVKEQKEVLHEMASDNKHLESSASDLKLRAAESDVYEKALEGHVAELEAICSILREQHDEQQKYFLQKESAMKRDAREKIKALEVGNKNLEAQIKSLDGMLQDEKLESVKHLKNCKKTEAELVKKESLISDLESSLKSAKHEMQIEKATVEMLTRKNNEMSQEILSLQTKINQLEVKGHDGEKSLDRRALTDISNTVQQYFEGDSPLSKKLENSLVASNNDKLEECERQLVYERQKRLSAEMEVSNLTVQLEKAKVELAISRNNSKRSSYDRRKNGRKSSGSPAQYSELLSSNILQTSQDSNVHDSVPVLRINGASGEASEVQSAQTSRSNTPEINSILSGSEISLRASQKMEEATKKALALLNNSSS